MDNETQEKTTETKQSHQTIDSLLPPAQIHLFSNDQKTIDTFQALAEDWRFGRITLSVRGKDLDEAINHYSRRKSPTLVIIQSDNTDDTFQTQLDGLAGVCNEGTAAIVIGPVNDVQLYRHLTGMGISDYLVKPVASEQLVEAIARSLEEMIGAVNSHLLAVTGVKGGVGTTTVSAMIAHILANDLGQKTLILDASGGASTLWNHFGFAPSGTLIEATRAIVDHDEDAFNRLIIKRGEQLHVLNSGAESILDNPVATQAFEMLLDKCLSVYPNVVLDLSRAPVQLVRMVAARANAVAVVATPRVPDLSIAKLLLKDLNDMPGAQNRKPFIFLNKCGLSKSSDIAVSDINEALQTDNIASLPWDGTMFAESENGGDFIGKQSGFKPFLNTLLPVITKLMGHKPRTETMTPQTSGGLGSLFGLFKGGK